MASAREHAWRTWLATEFDMQRLGKHRLHIGGLSLNEGGYVIFTCLKVRDVLGKLSGNQPASWLCTLMSVLSTSVLRTCTSMPVA